MLPTFSTFLGNLMTSPSSLFFGVDLVPVDQHQAREYYTRHLAGKPAQPIPAGTHIHVTFESVQKLAIEGAPAAIRNSFDQAVNELRSAGSDFRVLMVVFQSISVPEVDLKLPLGLAAIAFEPISGQEIFSCAVRDPFPDAPLFIRETLPDAIWLSIARVERKIAQDQENRLKLRGTSP